MCANGTSFRKEKVLLSIHVNNFRLTYWYIVKIHVFLYWSILKIDVGNADMKETYRRSDSPISLGYTELIKFTGRCD